MKMNNEEMDKKIINLQIENILYPVISLLKQTNKPKLEIMIEIEKFRERNRQSIKGMEDNYIEKYLNKMYAKRNNGEILIELKEESEKEEKEGR